VSGFRLHAAVAVRANQRNKRERLCRYIGRPVLSAQRLSLTAGGKVRYQLKTPWRNGTTHVMYEPLDFLAMMRIIASIEDPVVIKAILAHLRAKPTRRNPGRHPGARRLRRWLAKAFHCATNSTAFSSDALCSMPG
jgi:hypothetical protein